MTKSLFLRGILKNNKQTKFTLPNHCLNTASTETTSLSLKELRLPRFFTNVNESNNTFFISFPNASNEDDKNGSNQLRVHRVTIPSKQYSYTTLVPAIRLAINNVMSTPGVVGTLANETSAYRTSYLSCDELVTVTHNDDTGFRISLLMPPSTTKEPKIFAFTCSNSPTFFYPSSGSFSTNDLTNESFSLMGGYRVNSSDSQFLDCPEMFNVGEYLSVDSATTPSSLNGGAEQITFDSLTKPTLNTLDELYIHIHSGFNVRNIASDCLQFFVSPTSEETHSSSILARMNVGSTGELIFDSKYASQAYALDFSNGLADFSISITDHYGRDLCEYEPTLISKSQVDITLTMQYDVISQHKDHQPSNSGQSPLIFDTNRQYFSRK